MVDYITSLVIVFMVLGIPDKKGCRFESPRKVHLQERIFATDIYEIAFIYLWRSISLNNSVGRETVQLNLLFFISALM